LLKFTHTNTVETAVLLSFRKIYQLAMV